MELKNNIMRKKIFFILIAISFGFQTFAQEGNYKNKSFQANEKLTYIASYYMSGLWSDIAELNMEVSEVKTKTKTYYRLTAKASTYSSWDSYFKIRDLYESYVDPENTQPSLFKRLIDEGGYQKDVKFVYKRNQGLVSSTIKRGKGKPVSKSTKISKNANDLISILYNSRNIDFSSFRPGQTKKFNVLFDSGNSVKEETITVKFLGTENIKLDKHGKKECYKLSIAMKDEQVLKGKDTNILYLTADKNRVPVLIKAQIPVGSIQIRLSDMSGLKH